MNHPANDLAWWSRLRHWGLLLSPAVMAECYPSLSKLRAYNIGILRQASDQFKAAIKTGKTEEIAITEKAVLQFTDCLLESLLGYTASQIIKQGQFPDGAVAFFQIGSRKEAIRPHRMIMADDAKVIIAVDTNRQIGRGRGRTAYARLIELLRATGTRIGILSNGLQIRLIYTGLDTESWCEWEIERWFDRAEGEQELAGLYQLLNPVSINPPKAANPKDQHLSLLAAFEESRKRQADLAGVLGESVRRAVEHLTDELSIAARSKTDLLEIIQSAPDGKRLSDLEVQEALLQACVRVVMRSVVCLFAEARELFPIGEPIYAKSYSARTLYESLNREQEYYGSLPKLGEYHSAWPRLVALYRLIHDGFQHTALTMNRYGGLLFRPGSETDPDPVLRALSIFERHIPISDLTVYQVLRKLSRGKFRATVGHTSREVEGPVDYTGLRTEFIGMIYEGLLDFKLKRATDDVQVFLNIGREPVLPLERLEGMLASDRKGLKDLLTKLSKEKATGSNKSEEDSETDEIEETQEPTVEAAPSEDMFATEESTEPDTAAAEDSEPLLRDHLDADLRAQAWAKEAVVIAGLAPKKRKTESDYQYDKRLDEVARSLIRRVVGNGEFFLVRAGNVRKGTGTFYTKPQLAVPTVHRTLEPLCYERVGSNSDLTGVKTPKLPEQILSLKVCDPACGSASFLVAALHYLTDALYRSLKVHSGLEDPENYNQITLPFGAPRKGVEGEELVPLPPNDPSWGHTFEERVKSILRRHIVERCIYGADINPLAVEFARVSLWVETMDKELPFGFLDHKIKVGNGLVGCWLDQVLDYPLKAWERDGGDGKDGERTDRIDTFLKGEKVGNRRSGDGRIKQEMRSLINNKFRGQRDLFPGEHLDATDVATEAREQYDSIHSIASHNEDDREAAYRAMQNNRHVQRLKRAMDEWCAVWFWPMDEESAKRAPTPASFHKEESPRVAIVERLAHEHRFFHWELEFPDVFTPARSGFNAMLGNPPWEVMKPNSHEFFSNYDPLYRTYDKQEALRRQRELFALIPESEERWEDYCAGFKAMSNWVSFSVESFELNLARGKEGERLSNAWKLERAKRKGFAPAAHPFRHQGSADLNSYKMFLEIAYDLMQSRGRLGLIVPSGLYTDAGTRDLRTLFLEQSSWDWLFSFENRRKIFDIHSSFKFAAVIVEKTPPPKPVILNEAQRSEESRPLKAAFMVHDATEWERPAPPVFDFDRSLIQLFSPRSKSLPEVRTLRDLEISRKIYDHSFRIGDNLSGWEMEYLNEVHMTNDSRYFSPLDYWLRNGFAYSKYGFWINHEGRKALPLYEGRMLGQFDPMSKGWVSGKGRTAIWRQIPSAEKNFEAQFLMDEGVFKAWTKGLTLLKPAYMRITSATNTRAMIAAAIPGYPCEFNVALNKFLAPSNNQTLYYVSLLNSLVFDFTVKQRFGGIALNWFIVEECPIPKSEFNRAILSFSAARLNFIHRRFAPEWLKLKQEYPELDAREWKHWWAVTEADRLRLRVEIDALCAGLYGLDPDDFDWILRDDPSDPKGFWRVDKTLPFEERLTGLAARAFRALKEGKWTAESAATLSNDEFFDLLGIPELTSESAARAKGLDRPLIYKRNGCHSWKPELFSKDDPRHGWTWDDCRADAIALLGSEEALEKYLNDEQPQNPESDPGAVDMFGHPLKVNLFGEEVEKQPRRKK